MPRPPRLLAALAALPSFLFSWETALSPDGKLVVWQMQSGTAADTHSRIFLADSRKPLTIDNLKRRIRGNSSPPIVRPMTRVEEDAVEPSFAPDGKSIAFLSARGSGAFTQAWSLSLSGGEAEPITSAAANVQEYEWGSSGALLYLTREPYAIWILEGAGVARPLFESTQPMSGLAISNDARHLAFNLKSPSQPADATAVFSLWNSELHVLDLESLEVLRLTNRTGPEFRAAWSFDDKEIYFLAPIEEAVLAHSPGTAPAGAGGERVFDVDPEPGAFRHTLYRVPAAGGDVFPVLKRLDARVSEFRSCRDSDRLFAAADVDSGESIRLLRIRPRERSYEVLVERDGIVRQLAVRNDGEKVYFFYTALATDKDPAVQSELASWTFPDEDLVVLTSLNRKPDAP